mmetsp:Transcript_33143/g.109527  ORF Transcript_33143/g.109527 Transcript_33143/m.109527 type:complete len:202 (-) Transcript_33143:17-622(-)
MCSPMLSLMLHMCNDCHQEASLPWLCLWLRDESLLRTELHPLPPQVHLPPKQPAEEAAALRAAKPRLVRNGLVHLHKLDLAVAVRVDGCKHAPRLVLGQIVAQRRHQRCELLEVDERLLELARTAVHHARRLKLHARGLGEWFSEGIPEVKSAGLRLFDKRQFDFGAHCSVSKECSLAQRRRRHDDRQRQDGHHQSRRRIL